MVTDTEKEKPMISPFGVWLKEKRVARGLSQRDLAAAANDVCTYGYISMLETGSQGRGKKGKMMQPDEQIVERLAQALGESLNEARTIAGYPINNANFRETVLREFADALHRYHNLSDHAREFAKKHFSETIEFLLNVEKESVDRPESPKGGKKLKLLKEAPNIHQDDEQ